MFLKLETINQNHKLKMFTHNSSNGCLQEDGNLVVRFKAQMSALKEAPDLKDVDLHASCEACEKAIVAVRELGACVPKQAMNFDCTAFLADVRAKSTVLQRTCAEVSNHLGGLEKIQQKSEAALALAKKDWTGYRDTIVTRVKEHGVAKGLAKLIGDAWQASRVAPTTTPKHPG